MPPRAHTPQPLNLQSLISSTTYPQPFSLEQLEHLRSEVQQRRAFSHARLVEIDPAEGERMKQEKRERKRREKERLEVAQMELEGVRAVKRERTSLSPAASIASTSSRPVGMPVTYGSQMKKKKKRVLDSDDEGPARDRSATLASPPHHITTSGLKVRLPPHAPPKSRPLPILSEPYTPAGPSYTGPIDFSLPSPASRPLIPPRPGVQKPLQAGPKRQSEVDEDFSNVKAPPQVAFPTFWAGVEPYIREIREDDLALLGFKADDSELFKIPPRGRHYSEIWDEEDGNPLGTTHRISVPNLRQLNGTYPPNAVAPPWIPVQDIRDENLVEELRGLGGVTERVVAACVALEPDLAVTGRPAPEFEGKEAGRVDVRELEERMKKELRAVMLLGEHEDYDSSKRDDDEITSALRSCQRLLVSQTATNDARKLRLAERAKYRLAYAEYQNALEGVESNIEEHWGKRTKKHGHGSKKSAATKGDAAGKGEGKPPVSDNLKKLIQVRRGWVDSVGERMRGRPRGELTGITEESIYQGIEEEEDEERVEGVVSVDMDGE